MNAKEAKEKISAAVVETMKIKLERGERCPFCGHKKGERKVTQKMIDANRRNAKKAVQARKKA